MPGEPNKEVETELARLEPELERNEEFMRQAALKYEDLIAAKESLTAYKDTSVGPFRENIGAF